MSAAEIVANERLIESIKNNHHTLFLLSVEQLIELYLEKIQRMPLKLQELGLGMLRRF